MSNITSDVEKINEIQALMEQALTRFVSLSQLARRCGVTPTAIANRLNAAGIQPVVFGGLRPYHIDLIHLFEV